MTAFIALLAILFVAEPRVTGLSVTPIADRTEVLILVDGTVTPRHFMLDDGRIVIDLNGVSQAPRLDLADFNRGGVRSLRIAQFNPNTARVVIGLDRRADYEFAREQGGIRISFPNRAGSFEAWSQPVGGAAARPVADNTPRANGNALTNAPAPGVLPAAPDATRPNARVKAQEPRSQQRPISVIFENRPINEVLGLFSEVSGRTILASPAVQAKLVTAEIRGVPWDEALSGILEANGMVMRVLPSGLLLVEDAAAVETRSQAAEPTITETFIIQYVNADSIRTAVQGLMSPAGKVTVSKSSNTLLVTDVVSAVDRVRNVIPQLDVKTPQVDISAKIVFIDRTALEAFGIVYDLKDSRGNQLNRLTEGQIFDENGNRETTSDDVVTLGGASIAGLGNANLRVASPSLELLTNLVLGRHSLVSFIEALHSISMSDIQASPTIRTMDHRLATIQVGEETPIRTIDAGAAGGGAGAPRATVDRKQTGIILEVTPHITGNQVMLELHAERSNVAVGPADVGVIFQTQNATTQVLVNDGETVVIGGLTIIEKTKARAGIPYLMDLPVIGKLFRNETERENKRDLLIMVKPHIVRD